MTGPNEFKFLTFTAELTGPSHRLGQMPRGCLHLHRHQLGTQPQVFIQRGSPAWQQASALSFRRLFCSCQAATCTFIEGAASSAIHRCCPSSISQGLQLCLRVADPSFIHRAGGARGGGHPNPRASLSFKQLTAGCCQPSY